jgi:hypothetical protein
MTIQQVIMKLRKLLEDTNHDQTKTNCGSISL